MSRLEGWYMHLPNEIGRHLASHGLTPEQYREKYDYKKGTSLVAKSLARDRRKTMQGMKLWEKRKKVTKAE